MIIRETVVRDYLSPSKLGEFAINPYVGCPHACKYCYAEFMKRFTKHTEPWGTFLDVKRCDKEIDLDKISGKTVFMSTVTDCYNPYEAKYGITRSILYQLVNSDCHLQISTKNNLILRDLDLLKKVKHLSVALSINTLDENFRGDMDHASSIAERLETLDILHKNGIYTILFMSPIFIHITDWRSIIDVSRKYVNEYWFEDLNLRGSYKWPILRYIKKQYPQFYAAYERAYLHHDRTEIRALENQMGKYCDSQKICHSDYFHHEVAQHIPEM
jgi:DNA repair photolyase